MPIQICVRCSLLALPRGQHLLWVLSERDHQNTQEAKERTQLNINGTCGLCAEVYINMGNDELNKQLENKGTEAKRVALGQPH